MEEEEIIKEYSNEDITVVWKPKTCTHSKKCWKGLLQVFNPQNRPWINMDGATTARIKKQVDACPSGALTFVDKNESLERVEDSSTTKINILANGPLIVHGTIQLEDAEGNVTEHTHKTALCRCGASGNKPFCDGSHVKAGFKAI